MVLHWNDLSNCEWKENKFSDFVDFSPTISMKGGVEYSFRGWLNCCSYSAR
jgi:hypothetical protein